MVDLADPRIAVELEKLRRGGAALEAVRCEARRVAAEHAEAMAEFERIFLPNVTPSPLVAVMVVVEDPPTVDLGLDATDPVRH